MALVYGWSNGTKIVCKLCRLAKLDAGNFDCGIRLTPPPERHAHGRVESSVSNQMIAIICYNGDNIKSIICYIRI